MKFWRLTSIIQRLCGGEWPVVESWFGVNQGLKQVSGICDFYVAKTMREKCIMSEDPISNYVKNFL